MRTRLLGASLFSAGQGNESLFEASLDELYQSMSVYDLIVIEVARLT